MIKESEETINEYKFEYSVFKDKINSSIGEKDYVSFKLTLIDIIYTVKFGVYIILNLLDIAKNTLAEDETIDSSNKENLLDFISDKKNFVESDEFKGIYTSFLCNNGYILGGDDDIKSYLDTYSVSGCRTLEPETSVSLILSYSGIFNKELEVNIVKKVHKIRDKVLPLVHAVDTRKLENLKDEISNQLFLGKHVIKDLLVELRLFLVGLPNSYMFSSVVDSIGARIDAKFGRCGYYNDDVKKELNKLYPTLYPFDSGMIEAYENRLLDIYNSLNIKRLRDYDGSDKAGLFCRVRKFVLSVDRSLSTIDLLKEYQEKYETSLISSFKEFLNAIIKSFEGSEDTLLEVLNRENKIPYFGKKVTFYIFDNLLKNDLSVYPNHEFVDKVIHTLNKGIKFNPNLYKELLEETGYMEHELDDILYKSLIVPFIK